MINFSKLILSSLFFVKIFFLTTCLVNADRLKDLTSIAGVRSNQLVGYGIVVGLAGTGDGNIGLTLQSMQSMVSRFGLATDIKGLDGKNTAAVMVTGELGAFGKPGQNMNVTVSTVGKAKSLRGGTLLMTPLLGADGETYAVAQGNLVVGGLGVEGGDGSSLTVNIPTVGRIPRGATIEKMVETPFINSENIIFFNQDGGIERLKDYDNIFTKKGNSLLLSLIEDNNQSSFTRPFLETQFIDTQSNYLLSLRKYNESTKSILLSDSKHRRILLESIILKHLLEMNEDLELSLSTFRRGLEIQFPNPTVFEDNFHLIDSDIISYYYEIYDYYNVFEGRFDDVYNDYID